MRTKKDKENREEETRKEKITSPKKQSEQRAVWD
jgi:hypothetical protein